MSDLSDWLSDSRSFVRSNLSESLTVAHLIWAILANERMSDEQMIEFPALLILDDARCLAPWSNKATIYNVYIQLEYEGSVYCRLEWFFILWNFEKKQVVYIYCVKGLEFKMELCKGKLSTSKGKNKKSKNVKLIV